MGRLNFPAASISLWEIRGALRSPTEDWDQAIDFRNLEMETTLSRLHTLWLFTKYNLCFRVSVPSETVCYFTFEGPTLWSQYSYYTDWGSEDKCVCYQGQKHAWEGRQMSGRILPASLHWPTHPTRFCWLRAKMSGLNIKKDRKTKWVREKEWRPGNN